VPLQMTLFPADSLSDSGAAIHGKT